MRKTTYLLLVLLLALQNSYSQEKYSRIKISNPSQQLINSIGAQGIDLSCGVKHDGASLILEVSETELNKLGTINVPYELQIDDISEFYVERAEQDMISGKSSFKPKTKSRTSISKSSVSSIIKNNIIQYTGEDEIDFVEPQNFPDVNTLTMGGCLTISQVESQLDAMRSYSQTNGLDIVSVKSDASSSGQKTWGNPTNNFVNQHTNGPSTYSGTGSTRWNPQTIYYVRITGNESTTTEGTKPQILYTSMIHSRELSALMNNIYFMWYIIENYNTDPGIKELVDNNELYFVPVVNPDGLRYNQVTNPNGGGMQRKNLRPLSSGSIDPNRGVDLNRNFDYYFGLNNVGSSGTTTSGTYRGPSAESEPETQIMVDFIESRNFKSAVWNHSYANSVPHPYGGDPNANTDREDEYYRWHEEMTRYNRYLYGATIFYESNGLPDDWMMGGAPDNNGSTGLNQAIIATTPEHGGEGFWPARSSIVPIAKRSMRISLATAYYGGKYAKLHDLTQSDITTTSNVDLDFGIERIGQTQSGFNVTVTPISSNILNITSPGTVTGIDINTTPTANTFRNQTEVTALMDLDPAIQPNDKIEYNVKFSNDDGIIYEANYEKYYQPSVLLSHDSDTETLADEWDQTNGWSETTTDAYSATTAIYTGTYSNSVTKRLTTKNSYDFSNSSEVVIQFYTKWDIERNYDFVEVLGSPDGGTNWVSLKGNYTKPNATSATTSHDNKSSSYANFQANSSGEVYDGDRMDNWVMEEITIDGNYASLLSSNNVKIRFNFRTDALNVNESYTTTNDGFYIDDFKIISIQIPCVTTIPTSIAVSGITDSSANVSWDNIPSATYDIRYKETLSSTWTEVTDLASPSYAINGLTPTTDYEVQVRTRCTTATSAYSASVNFTTTDLIYCTAIGGSIADEYIGGVTVNSIINDTSPSGNGTSSGYSDFTGSNIFDPIQVGSTGNSISVSKYWNNVYNEAVSVWIDFNKNGAFEASEKILEDGANQNTPISDTFTVPSGAITGNTTMRVIMKYINGAGTLQTDPCEDFNYGEVEDYSIYLYDGMLFTNSTWYPSAPDGTTGSVNALILDGTFNANSNFEVNDLTVNNGATLNLNKANAITVNGDVSTSGDLVLNSDSNEFSSLLVTGNVSGDVKYHRHVNSNAGDNDLIAPPVSGESFVDFLSNNSNVFANGTQTLFLFGDFEKPSNQYQLFSNTETASLDAGKGYRAASTDDSTFEFTGSVTTSNLVVPIERTGATYTQWNLIGNPYTSYIRLSDFLTANITELDPLSAAVYGYDADDSNGSNWAIWNLAYSDANPGTLIAPGQGFFVSARTGSNVNITFESTMRTAGNSDDFIAGRNSTPNIAHSIIEIDKSNETFETELYFTDNATTGLDIGYDAEHFGGAPANFSIYTELVDNNQGTDMSVQSIAFNDVNNNAIIPVGLNLGQGEQATIRMTSSNASFDIFLEDTQENTFTLLNNTEYTFTADSNLSDIGRFYLRFNSNVLSTNEASLDHISIYNDNNLEEIVVKGQLEQEASLTLYDTQGREILNKTLETNNSINRVKTTGFMSGVYLVKLQNNVTTITKKLIIK
ncbi:M14 family zinc carboxypeptidase [Winogradskyella sp. A2]|uniref:M14 family zinc carboxypeptidase n=1 Tax=Winogradskyella sp. A2 TaxID=3366944 RepID=UPI00398C7B02